MSMYHQQAQGEGRAGFCDHYRLQMFWVLVFLRSLQPGHLRRAQHPGSFTCPCGLAPKGQWGCVTTSTFVCSQELGTWCCTLGSFKAEHLSRRAFLPPGWTGPLVWIPSSREVRSEPQSKEDHICLNEEERTQSKLSLTLHRGQKSTCGSQFRPPWPVGPGSCLGRTRYPHPEPEAQGSSCRLRMTQGSCSGAPASCWPHGPSM